jgi:hypothetical protein
MTYTGLTLGAVIALCARKVVNMTETAFESNLAECLSSNNQLITIFSAFIVSFFLFRFRFNIFIQNISSFSARNTNL